MASGGGATELYVRLPEIGEVGEIVVSRTNDILLLRRGAVTMENQGNYKTPGENTAYPLTEILKDMPPGRSYSAIQATRSIESPSGSYNVLITPELTLLCDNEKCHGERIFDCIDDFANKQSIENGKELFLHYRCRNCKCTTRAYAIYAKHTVGDNAQIVKLGEWPPFLPQTSSRVLRILEPDLGLYHSGRRSESQGLGIGAFAYYRRVVDSQWRRLLDEIGKVARRIGVDDSLIEKAKQEDQFSKAVAIIKDGLPSALLLDGGHNPLTLLYAALSHHLHSETDESCLELARSVRLILGHLSERIDVVLKDSTELRQSVSRLLADPSRRQDEPE
jgi:hypothetical protein